MFDTGDGRKVRRPSRAAMPVTPPPPETYVLSLREGRHEGALSRPARLPLLAVIAMLLGTLAPPLRHPSPQATRGSKPLGRR